MERYLVLYNPHAQQGHGLDNAKKIEACCKGAEIAYRDMTKITDYTDFFEKTPVEVKIVFTGGDGTLNRVINALYDMTITRDLYYFGAGTGNDFLTDLGKKPGAKPFVINPYMKDLPCVSVQGKQYRFINGIGFGMDGYCCEESDRLHALGKQKSYGLIAFEGVLGKYRTTKAKVTVDGETREFDKVWMAPTMYGSFYGGGFDIAPSQHRNNAPHTVTSVLVHGVSRWLAVILFLSVKKGNGEKMTKYMDYRVGHHVTVEFDRPIALQVDGETFLNVTEYSVDYPA